MGRLLRGCGLACLVFLSCKSGEGGDEAGSGTRPNGPDDDPAAACDPPNNAICNGACVQVATDAKNCGRCGRDCLDSTCGGGVCAPVLMAESPIGGVAPTGPIAVDATFVYWGNSSSQCAVGGNCNTVYHMPKNGGMATIRSFASARHAVSGIALDTTGTYWTNGLSVMSCPGNSCGPFGDNPTTLVDGRTATREIVARGGNVFWGESFGVFACPIAGCPSNTPTSIHNVAGEVKRLAIDDTSLYIAGGRAVARCVLPSCTGGVSEIAAAPEGVVDVAVDATDLFFASPTTIYRCALSGCAGAPAAVTSIAPDFQPPHHLAIDATHLYWAAGGAIQRCAKSGCATPETINPAEAQIKALTMDDKSIYFVLTTRNGGIKRIAK